MQRFIGNTVLRPHRYCVPLIHLIFFHWKPITNQPSMLVRELQYVAYLFPFGQVSYNYCFAIQLFC